ncbi:PQQ-binding-like beta-propeller repeat protein [Halolamina sediminis]|uniref:PQQ-binding-like beta-propeller repeat protein n=1 Tax=Halolamina sediminis TaxID=1480675 RepID=UPI0006B52A62|nr:PQQ-binding-like beta-propeller repeat protein [Halolamina sediminis]
MTDDESDQSESPSYTRIDSFRAGSVQAAAGGETGLVVADDEGTAVLIGAGTRRTLVDDATGADVAMADHAYLLTADGLEAFDADGERVWTVDVDGESVEADPAAGDVYVATGEGTFVRFDAESGAELGRFDQSRPDLAETPAIAAADSQVAVALWTFLTVFSAAGEELTAITLDGAAVDVGFLDGTVVVSLKDGQLIAYDEGAKRWESDRGFTWLADGAETALLGYAGNQACLVDRDGGVTELRDVRGEPIAATSDTSLLATHHNGTVTVYGAVDAGAESISVSIDDDAITPSNSVVEVAFENDGGGPAETTASVDVDGATPSTPTLSATIPPGGRVDERVSLRDIDEDRESVTVTVVADGQESTVTVPIETEQRDIAVSVDPLGVDHGEATVEVTVANEGSVPLTDVVASEREIGTVRPGAEHTFRIEGELPTSPVSVRTAELSPSTFGTELPPTPTDIGLDVDENGLLVVSLENDTPAPVLDELTLENAHTVDGELSFEIEIPERGQYRLSVPVLEAGERSVAVDTAAGRVSRQLSLDRTPGFEQSRAEPRTVSAGSSADRLDDGEPSDQGTASVDRSFSTETPTRGERFVERLSVGNDGEESVQFELVADDGDYRIPVTVDAGSEAVGRRDHAAFGDEITVPAVRLESDDGEAFAPARSLPVEAGAIEPRITWAATDDGCELWYEFTSDDTACELSAVSFPGGPSVPLDLELGANETGTGTVTVDWRPDSEVVRATVTGRGREVETLVPNESLVDRTTSRLDDLAVDADAEWGNADQPNSNVYLRFENEGDEPIRDLRFEAEGPDLDEWTVPKHVDEIAPGDGPTEYPIHLVSVGPNTTGEVEVEVTAEGGAERLFTVRVSADENAEVPPGAISVQDSSPSSVRFPDSVSGPYR